MNVPGLYLQLLALVVLPLVVGMVFSRGRHARAVASKLFAFALYFFQTLIPFLAVWKARLGERSWIIPVITVTGWIVSIGAAYLAELWLKHPPRQKGSFLFTACISNHGYSLLGIIALMVFGEAGLAQASYGQLFFMPFLIFICFPIARAYGDDHGRQGVKWSLKENIFDRRNLPLVAMIAGLVLNLSGTQRPAVCSQVVPIAVYCGTLVSGVAVGLLFNPSSIFRYPRENLFSLIYRSTLYPLFFFVLARLLGLGRIDTCVLTLYGIVPSAIFSNLIADMFKLDSDLANSVYIVSTGIFLVVVLPLYLCAVAC